MKIRNWRLISLLLGLTIVAQSSAGASNASATQPSPLLGAAGFYPSSERPVGWRGDGSGAWPGATPVRQWNAKSGTNIVWRTQMPGPSFSQPIVVGDKVFTLADPNWLICLSAVDGKVIWQKQVDQTAAMSPQTAAAARQAQAFWDEQFSQYAIWLDQQRGYKTDLPKQKIDQALAAADAHDFTVNGPGQANFRMISRSDPLWDRCMRDEARYSIYTFGHWEGILTHTFPTPVSDGQCIYVNMANDQVACYDLDGNCKWLLWDRPQKARADEQHVRYAMSPQLAGDKLIVAACGELRAYDKHTGKKLWSVFQPRDFGMYWVKVGTPIIMHLQYNGKSYGVILSPGSGIYRLSDGAMVGSLPPLTGYEGSTALTDGRIYVRKDAPDSGHSVRVAGTFNVVTDNQVQFQELWRLNGVRRSACNTCDILYDGWIYSPQEGRRIAMATGKTEKLATTQPELCSPAMGGNLLVTVHGGNYRPREKHPGIMQAQVIDLTNPVALLTSDEAFVDQRYEHDQAYRLRWRWRGNGDSISNSSPMFAANRMFFRTVGYLWCVGDPGEKWPINHNAPQAARVAQ